VAIAVASAATTSIHGSSSCNCWEVSICFAGFLPGSSVTDKPMFRDAFRRRRCNVLASGFFEWTGKKGPKQPHLFTAADGPPLLAFADLWDRWNIPNPANGCRPGAGDDDPTIVTPSPRS
jgi:putative SOS response-associated peptidase YedK